MMAGSTQGGSTIIHRAKAEDHSQGNHLRFTWQRSPYKEGTQGSSELIKKLTHRWAIQSLRTEVKKFILLKLKKMLINLDVKKAKRRSHFLWNFFKIVCTICCKWKLIYCSKSPKNVRNILIIEFFWLDLKKYSIAFN